MKLFQNFLLLKYYQNSKLMGNEEPSEEGGGTIIVPPTPPTPIPPLPPPTPPTPIPSGNTAVPIGSQKPQKWYGRVNYWGDLSETEKDLNLMASKKMQGYMIEMSGWADSMGGELPRS